MADDFVFQDNELLSRYSTFQIGGPARLFKEVDSISQMQDLIRYCYQKKIPYFVLGKGSNSLFDDRGFDGLVILNKICFCEMESGKIKVGAGYSFSLLGTQTAKKGWAGLEFASGIPGSIGGAVYMNAGANGGETADVLTEVQWISEEGELKILPKEQLEFSYRHSSFQGKKGAIVGANFVLQPSENAREKQLGQLSYRMKTQPYHDPSIGCIFRNPQGCAAGALIEELGLKGKQSGGAEVSLMHGNFIVNKGGAKASDVLDLAKEVKRIVQEKKGIELELEVRLIPFQEER